MTGSKPKANNENKINWEGVIILLVIFLLFFSIIFFGVKDEMKKSSERREFCKLNNLSYESDRTDCLNISNNIIIKRYNIKVIKGEYYLE